MSSVRDFAQDRANLDATAPRRRACIARLQEYLDRTGLHPEDFAPRVGYGYATIRHFLADRYHRISGNDSKVIEAVDTYLAQAPGRPGRADRWRPLRHGQHRRHPRGLLQLTTKPRAMLLYGPPGSQKSFGLETEVARYNAAAGDDPKAPRAYYVYARDGVTPKALLKRVAAACGTRASGEIDRVLLNLKADHSGRRVIVTVDEAQHLDLKCFNVIRELLGRDRTSRFCSPDHTTSSTGLALSRPRLSSSTAASFRRFACPAAPTRRLRASSAVRQGNILERQSPEKAMSVISKLIAQSTVTDATWPPQRASGRHVHQHPPPSPTALDDLRSQYEAKQQLAQESAA